MLRPMPRSHGDHDLRVLVADKDEARDVCPELNDFLISMSHLNLVGSFAVSYCPKCQSSTWTMVSSLDSDGVEESSRMAVSEFRKKFPDSCASAIRLEMTREVMET